MIYQICIANYNHKMKKKLYSTIACYIYNIQPLTKKKTIEMNPWAHKKKKKMWISYIYYFYCGIAREWLQIMLCMVYPLNTTSNCFSYKYF